MKVQDQSAKAIIKAAEDKGFEIFLVGGFVRDCLMGKSSNDIDMATAATPEEMKEIFSSFRIVETGIKHGTLTVIASHKPFEITTFRKETGYSDCRHPDSVEFTKRIEEDLARRDFTVNSIAFSEKRGFVDPFGGKEDIEKKIIRCVGHPQKRFEEDALRILRALRFSSVLGFSIEEATEKAMFRCKNLLKSIANERVFAELSKTLCGKNIRQVLTRYSEIFSVVLPEIEGMKGFDQHNYHHIYDVLEHTAVVLENTPALLHLRLAALFHDCAKPDCFSLDEKGIGHFYSHPSLSAKKADEALLRLRCDTRTREKVVKLVKLHDAPIEESESTVKKKLSRLGEEMFFDLVTLKRADTSGLAPAYHSRSTHFDTLEATAKKIIKEKACFSLRELAVDGNDIASLGFQGKDIGNMLKLLLEAVIKNETENEKEKLLALCKEKKRK